MFQKDWEKRWEKYGRELASSIHENELNNKTEWLSPFLQSSVLLSTILIPSMVTFITEFPMKMDSFDEKIVIKKLNKAKKEHVQKTIKLFLMDYFATFLEHPVHILLLEQQGMEQNEIDNQIVKALRFTKEEKALYEEVKVKKETYYPTIALLQNLHAGKDAHNQALVEGLELFKEEAFGQMDKNFQTLFTQFKKD